MTRRQFLERTLRQIYGGQPSDDSNITYGLANIWLSDGIGLAARANYKDNTALAGIGFVNNSFYTSYKSITVTEDSFGIYKLTLPEVPIGIGYNEGVSTLQFKDSDGNISLPCVPMSENQRSFFQTMRPVPNKILFYYEGNFIYALSTIQLFQYTANVTMISGGDSTDLSSILNVPADYIPIIVQYIQQQLIIERKQPVDATNDGLDAITTT